jgi:hypothetical protein
VTANIGVNQPGLGGITQDNMGGGMQLQIPLQSNLNQIPGGASANTFVMRSAQPQQLANMGFGTPSSLVNSGGSIQIQSLGGGTPFALPSSSSTWQHTGNTNM